MIPTVRYPAALDTYESLFEVRNNAGTVLSAAITISDSDISVLDASVFPSSGFVSIDDEIVYYSSKSGNILQNCDRGQDGTIAEAHISGSPVRLRVIAIHHMRLADSIIAIQTLLGTLLSNVSQVPIGTPLMWLTSTPPTGYLLLDGSTVSRTTYAALFAVYGTTFNTGGEAGTDFRLPNMKGRVPVGYDSTQTEFDALGKTGGVAYVDTSHVHTFSTDQGVGGTVSGRLGASSNQGNDYSSVATAVASITTDTGTSDTAESNLQPYFTVNYIVKY